MMYKVSKRMEFEDELAEERTNKPPTSNCFKWQRRSRSILMKTFSVLFSEAPTQKPILRN